MLTLTYGQYNYKRHVVNISSDKIQHVNGAEWQKVSDPLLCLTEKTKRYKALPKAA